MKNNILLNIHFETGDASCRYYEVLTVIHSDKHYLSDELLNNLEANIREVMSDERFEEEGYEEIVAISFDRLSDVSWAYFKSPVDNVFGVCDIFID